MEALVSLKSMQSGTSICLSLLCLLIVGSLTHCEARKWINPNTGAKHASNVILEHLKKLKVTKHFSIASLLLEKASNAEPYVSSPFTLPPYDSLPPNPLPENAPPYCIYPPNTPQPPSTTTYPSPTPPPFYYLPPALPLPNPPSSPTYGTGGGGGGGGGVVPSPPAITPGSPSGSIPSPMISTPNPSGPVISPPFYEPSPPSYIPSPPSFVPSPTGGFPSPVFKPPIVFPPPTTPPSPRNRPSSALWCVAKPSVPEPIMQEAMNYACGSGADCDSIQPSGACFEPNTVYAHASYALNSFWQRSKVAGGTCSFGGTAILVTVDPSYAGCHFLYA